MTKDSTQMLTNLHNKFYDFKKLSEADKIKDLDKYIEATLIITGMILNLEEKKNKVMDMSKLSRVN